MFTFPTFAQALLTALDANFVAVVADTSLYDEVGLDSLQALEMVLVIEQMADLLLAPPELPQIWTLGDAYEYYVTCQAFTEGRIDLDL